MSKKSMTLGGEEQNVEEDDDPQLIGEAKTAMTDVLTMNVNSSDKLSLEERVAMLNDQRRVFGDTFFIRSVMSRVNAPVI